MLQHNNNNNHPCLDMAHRELLHDCRRTSVSLSSALEFGAIPLIKGLRAWAVNGGYSKARKRASGPLAEGTCHQNAEKHYEQTMESTVMRPSGVRQGGLGGLVTVATLKGSDTGVRQTQTRCVFLQGQGSYIGDVGKRASKSPPTHTVILEETKEEVRCYSRGPITGQDRTTDGGLPKVKPKVTRKWRKCNKIPISAEKKKEIPNQCCPLEDKVTSGSSAKQLSCCSPLEKNRMKISDTAVPDDLKRQSQNLVTVSGKDQEAHLSSSNHSTMKPQDSDLETCRTSAKPCVITNEQATVEIDISASTSSNNLQESTCTRNDAQSSNPENVHETTITAKNFTADVPNFTKTFMESKDALMTLDCLKHEVNTTNANAYPLIKNPEVCVDNTGKNLEHLTEGLSEDCEIPHPVVNGELTVELEELLDTRCKDEPEFCNRNALTPAGVERRNTAETKRKPSLCSPQQWEELPTQLEELQVHQSDKSSSQGFSTPTAIITATTFHSPPNPAPTTTAAIATAIPALSQGEVGAGGGDLPLWSSELLSEPARVDDKNKVATEDQYLDGGEEEEDEFGAFMQADGEPCWTEEFSEVLPSAPRHEFRCDHQSTGDPSFWASDWSAAQSFQPSGSMWIAFSQETTDQKIVTGGQWWPLENLERPNLPFSSLQDVSNVLASAFPSEKPSSDDPGDIPTLKLVLLGPTENSNTEENGEKSFLDRLQDLDRIVGVKQKKNESQSHKLLVQSLHLERHSSECLPVRLKSSARFSPNLPTSNQQLAANAKRRLSYDLNRSITA